MKKRLSIEAYTALREALSVVTWNKKPFESLLRTALRDSLELLVGLNFNETKRIAAAPASQTSGSTRSKPG